MDYLLYIIFSGVIIAWFVKPFLIYRDIKNGIMEDDIHGHLYWVGLFMFIASFFIFPKGEYTFWGILIYVLLLSQGLWNIFLGYMISRVEKKEKSEGKKGD